MTNETQPRPTMDEYLMAIAVHAAKRSTCPRAQVGCVLTFDSRVVSTGYNGSLRGELHCTDIGCDLHNGSCIRSVHAEQNAICDAALRGVSLDGAVAYITHSPCWTCFKLLRQSGVFDIVYLEPYLNGAKAKEVLEQCERFSSGVNP